MEREIAWLLDDKYGGIESDAFHADVTRLQSGEPLAYVIGWESFMGTRIYLDSRPLIPRPETEFWVAKAIEDISKLNKGRPAILDMCAGSGCVGISTLARLPNATCDFVEIEEGHHPTILRNLAENGINAERTRILGGSLFEHVTGTYDAILANPPYIDPALAGRIQPSVIGYEPELALFGGKAGMELVEDILTQAPRFLNPGGLLYVEHEPEQVDAILAILPGVRFFEDQFGIVRYCVWKKPM